MGTKSRKIAHVARVAKFLGKWGGISKFEIREQFEFYLPFIHLCVLPRSPRTIASPPAPARGG